MATKTIKKMLGNLPVGMVDIVRLFVEAVEEGRLLNCTKYELIERFRKMVGSGAEAVREAEKTLPFGEVVKRSLELRAGRRKSTVYDLRSYAGRMVRYKDWAGRPLRGIGVEACREPDMQDMEPAVALMLWCGVRPAEVQRLTWKDVDPCEGVVYIPPQHSKTGGARLIPLRGAAARLQAVGDGTIAPCNWAKRWRALRARAGLLNWQQGVLRHTFASYHLRRFSNPPQLQAEMGHRDSTLLRTRYVNVRHLTAAAARNFWQT